MNNVLMIAFHYPPVGGSSGVLRTLKFSKYLQEFHWKPHILTVRERVHEARDDSLLHEIPSNISVLRTPALDTKKHLAIKGRYLELCAIPDTYIGWLPFAILKGLQAIRRGNIQALYSTSPIATAHLIALCLKRLTRLPWVADFRDPWVEVSLNPTGEGWRFRLESWLEERVLTQADRVTVTTNFLKEELIQRYPHISTGKFQVVMNGFDEEDFLRPVTVAQEKPSNQFELIHAGLLNESYRSPVSLLQALSVLVQTHKIPRTAVRFRLLGGGAYLQSLDFKRTLQSLNIEDVVHIGGLVPYDECLRQLAQSHLLVLIQGGADTKTLIPAKAFEYLRIEKPILAITPEGSATAELINEFNAGCVVDADNKEKLQAALLELYTRFVNGGLRTSIDQKQLKKYTRRELTKQLAGVFDHLRID